MARYATGKFAQRISDRSGMAFPYNEMVQEWNGSTGFILVSLNQNILNLIQEYHPTDPQSLQNAKPQTIMLKYL